MPRTHKDLPGGSQDWAAEVDKGLKRIAELEAVIRRLAENAGIDFSNPSRGVNVGDTPSIKNPVGQKLSSLADVATYNVAEGQVLSWSQQGQKWLPVTLPTPSAGGAIDISEVSYSGLTEGYGAVVDANNFAYTAAGLAGTAPYTYKTVETWSTGNAYYGAGNWHSTSTGYALLELDGGDPFFGRPFTDISANDNVAGTYAHTVFSSFHVGIDGAYLVVHRVATANRPTGLLDNWDSWGAHVYDTDLKIPIWWNGTTWTNALGTAV